MNVTTLAKATIYTLSSQKPTHSPSWKGDTNYSFKEVETPITDKSFWEGRFVYCPLRLRSGSKDLEYVDAITSINRQKRIVSTEVIGMNGSVKEYISEGDYELSIYLGLYGSGDNYPEEELRDLIALLSEPNAVEVQSTFLDLFDINKIVIKSYSLLQETESNRQGISISALSDEEYNVYSTDY